MVLINVFAAAGVIHGVGGLLLPKQLRLPTAAPPAAAPAAAVPATVPLPQPVAAAPAQHGGALIIRLPQLDFKPAVAVTISLGRRLHLQQHAATAVSSHGGSRRLAAVTRGRVGGGGGFRGGGGTPAVFDGRRADDNTFRAPSYASDGGDGRAGDATDAAAVVGASTARADDRAVSNTAYGLAVGAHAGADAAETAGWGGQGAYQPAPLPADDYADAVRCG